MAYIEITTDGRRYSLVCFLCETNEDMPGEDAAIRARDEHVKAHEAMPDPLQPLPAQTNRKGRADAN